MRQLFHPFWIGLTIVLTLVFIILFPASIISRHGPFRTTIFTLIGVSVIWIVYFVRAYILSNFSSEESETKKKKLIILGCFCNRILYLF
jgi:hypothetical protein